MPFKIHRRQPAVLQYYWDCLTVSQQNAGMNPGNYAAANAKLIIDKLAVPLN